MNAIRFVALGDSTTVGIGDPTPTGWRGWARILADALSAGGPVEFDNLAVSGGTAAVVRSVQLEPAVARRPHLASLVVGINDTMRSTWDPGRLRDDVLACASRLHAAGAVLLTARFHDHGAVFGLPAVLRRPLWRRIEQVNEVYAAVHATWGGVQVDLTGMSLVYRREFWSIDRLHPGELGHRVLARCYAEALREQGMTVPNLPPLEVAGGTAPSPWRDLAWMVTHGAPWVGRRARDLGPWAARLAWLETAALTRSRVEAVTRRPPREGSGVVPAAERAPAAG